MAQQFYTLDEAAKVLGVTPDEVKRMADRNEVRAFRDRGSMRFRGQEIDELARRRGRGSDPDLQLGETRTAPPSPPPAKPPSSKKGGGAAPEVFDFSLESGDSSDQVQIGQELNLSGSSKSKSGKSPKPGSGKSPPPKPGSDSDVRLVADGSDLDFQVASDSDVKLVDAPAPTPSATPPTKRKPTTPSPGKPGTGKPSSAKLMDSGVQMVPMDPGSDSDVRLQPEDSNVSLGPQRPKSGSDSDIRLESPKPRGARSPDSSAEMLTEEIDLDAELRKAEEAEKSRKPSRKKSQAKPAAPPLPTTSPFELSEADLRVPDAEQAATPAGVDESSSDFDLTPAGESSSPIEPSSGEIALEPGAEPSSGEVSLEPGAGQSSGEITLGELTGGGSKSGINLRDPADSGISLEQGGSSEEIEFELSKDESGPKTPPPAAAKSEVDSDSEFELSLDDSSGETPAAAAETDSDSEFELSLEPDSSPVDSSSPVESSSPVDSDSEFELTLDDSGGLALEGSSETEAATESGEQSGEKDIFETDFEVPSLDEESGSQAVALEDSDTDLESSDFDLALGDEDVASEEESGSQVVVLEDEGEVDEGAETVARPRSARGAPVLEEGEEQVEDLFDVGAAEGEEEEAAPAAVGAMVPAPAEWGVWPVALMLPSVVVMFLVMLMGFELVRQDGLNRPSNPLTRAITSMFSEVKD